MKRIHSGGRKVTRLALAAILCAAPAAAADELKTHEIVVTTPGGEIVSEPLTETECRENAARIDGQTRIVPLGTGIVVVTLEARCVLAGDAI